MARAPLTAVPATRSSLPLLKIRRRVIVVLLAGAIASGVVSSTVLLTTNLTPPAPPVVVSPEAVALAEAVAGDFLAGRTSLIPSAAGVDIDFSKKPNPGSATGPLTVDSLTYSGSTAVILGDGTRASPTTAEQVSFTARIDGHLYVITVPMTLSGNSWIAGGLPSLAPARTPGGGVPDPLDYQQLYAGAGAGTQSVLPTTGYTDQIEVWAKTYANAGQASPALYAITGDETANTYTGLGGWKVVGKPSVISVVPILAPFPGFIVQVSLVLHAPAANGPSVRSDYDLYLRSDRSQQQPPVVAWGAPGSYRSLTPFFNADQN